MSWPQQKLEDLVLQQKGSLVSGPFGSNISAKFFVDEGVPVIRGNNLTKGEQKFIDGGFAFLTDSKAAEFPNCIATEGDIIFTAAGSIGQVGIIPEERRFPFYIISNKQLRARLDRTKANPIFVYYWLSSRRMVHWLENMNNGGAVPLLNLGIVRKAPVPCPPIETQNRICDVLSAYDDLIENNRRRIQLLEESARLLYKEWFVHLRFPGHEDVSIIDGVPQGWERSTVGESSAFLSRGITPKYDEDAIGLVINQKCIKNRMVNLKLARSQSKQVPPKKVVQFGDVLINSTGAGTLGRVAQFLLKTDQCTVDSHVTIARPKNGVPIYYFGLRLTELETFIAGLGRGSTNQTELSKQDVQTLGIILPPVSLGQGFESKVEPIFHEIRVLSEQIEKLTQARDLLLPRLMNGEVAA